MKQSHLLVLVGLVGLSYFAEGMARGLEFDGKLLLQTFGISSGIGLAIGFFDRVLWKLAFLHPWFVPYPDLSGDWDIRSDRKPGDPGYVGTANVRQRFSSIEMNILWKDGSRSEFLRRSPLSDSGSALFSFAVEFSNSDKVKEQLKSGSFFFRTKERRPTSLRIVYSTNEAQVAVLNLSRPGVGDPEPPGSG